MQLQQLVDVDMVVLLADLLLVEGLNEGFLVVLIFKDFFVYRPVLGLMTCWFFSGRGFGLRFLFFLNYLDFFSLRACSRPDVGGC